MSIEQARVNADVDKRLGVLETRDTPLGVPTGGMMLYAVAGPPTGYLQCNGASVLRASYTRLFGVIGTTFGSADGTHFTLPTMTDISGLHWYIKL